MKKPILFFITFIALIAGLAFRYKKEDARSPVMVSRSVGAFQPVALIELFTSQGCSSCPAADKLLSQTINSAKKEGKNVLALAFHVDYWNRLGWTDVFSSKEYSERQNAYAAEMRLSGIYTPQMIVNGTREFVGSDEGTLKEALNRSLSITPAAVFTTLKASIENSDAPKVKYALGGDFAGCIINFALISLSETTAVKRGENGGRTLLNPNIVRQFISVPATAEGEVSFKNDPLPSGNNIGIVAYIQHNSDLKIVGASSAEIK